MQRVTAGLASQLSKYPELTRVEQGFIFNSGR